MASPASRAEHGLSGNDDPADWRAADMADPARWTVGLTQADRDAVARAARASQRSGVPIGRIDRAHFALPGLAERLAEAARAVVRGRGFVLLRGMPIDGLSREEVLRAYVGIGSHFGVALSQNAKGHLVGHVTDLGGDAGDPKTRIYTTTIRQLFHTDSCDIVGLLCLNPAKSGGASAIASSTAVVREMERRRPDLVKVLERPFWYDRKGEVPKGKDPYYPMPVVHRHAGHVTVIYGRDFITAAQARFPDLPRLTDDQIEALDLFDALTESDEFRLDMDFRPGDVQLLHNHQILHARTDYEDWPEPERKRHLIRLWLSAHDPRPLPPAFEERYGPIVEDRPRGGIRVPGMALTTPLYPE